MQKIHYPAQLPYTRQAQGLTLKEKLAFTFAGIIVLCGGVILVQRTVRKRQANAQQRLTYEDGSAATFAKQIKMAFDNDGWWGTDIESLRRVVVRIPTKQAFRQVIESYGKMYNQSMMAEMENELQSSEYNEVLAIISAKPERAISPGAGTGLTAGHFQGWAARLNSAFSKTYGLFPGTDEDAIRAVFIEIPSQTAFIHTANAYRGMYGRELTNDLKSELEFWEYGAFMSIIQQKPQ